MKRRLPVILAVGIIQILGSAAAPKEGLRVWKEFVTDLRAGKMEDAARIRPYYPLLLEPMKGYLGQLRSGVDWDKLVDEPEVFPVGNQIHCVISIPWRGARDEAPVPFCFTFLVEGGKWYFQHMETIMIRMDKLGPLPASTFPDVPAERKAWMREEIEISGQIQLFSYLAKDKGKEFAFQWFHDGAGYALAARAWVPFVAPEKAFILYMCWDYAHRRENPVTLEKLTETEAVVRVEPRWFELYEAAAHLKPQISAEDYRRLFETIWTNRAQSAGWDAGFAYSGKACVFRFFRKPAT
jgi:hypothetical protein